MTFPFCNVVRISAPGLALLALSACGGDATPAPPPPPPPPLVTYSIGGMVSGIGAGESVTLQDNGTDSLTMSVDGAFTFTTKVTSGGSYSVTSSAPAGKTCSVTGGSGTVSTNVTSVAVDCVISPTFSVGGTVSGLVGQGLTLDIVAASWTRPKSIGEISILSDGKFVFPSSIFTSNPFASQYAVGLAQQPHSPTQHCVVSDRYRLFAFPASITDMDVACGEFLYSTNTADNTISAFSVDAYSGVLVSAGPPVGTGLLPYAIAGTDDKKYLYVANSDSNNVSAFSANPRTGALTTIPGSPFPAGTRPRAVTLYRSTLFVANASSNTLSVYRVDPESGVPTPSSPASYTTGTGPSAMAIASGNGPYSGILPVLYVANTGSGDISAYWILGAYGPVQALESVAGSPFRAGSGVSSLALAGGFLYAATANGVDATISGFIANPSAEFNSDPNAVAWAALPGFPFALPSCNFIASDRSGTYLYATAGTNLLGYSIAVQTGALNLLPGFPVAVGANADSVSIDPTNQFLYVRNGSAGTVTGFELNAATGALTPMPGSPFAVGTSADFIATF